MYLIPFDKTIQNVVTLQAHTSAYVDTEKDKKLIFLIRLLELLSQKQFSMNDCFALQSYPKCNYGQLKDFLVLPCKRKLQYITSSIDKDQVLSETFDKVLTLQQKNVFLFVHEIQIRPTVSFSGGLLSGMAENNRDCKATSILITSPRCYPCSSALLSCTSAGKQEHVKASTAAAVSGLYGGKCDRGAAAPVVRDQAPVVRDQAPVVRDQAPVVRDQAPVVVECQHCRAASVHSSLACTLGLNL
ncbi:hypothetical protein FHG87_018667 [Trinorchestia longiramus]|nr:hypothetical protein FHG87_018667 [Trinorchestia longiramus]